MAAAMAGPGATVTRMTGLEALLAVRSVESEVMVMLTAVGVQTAVLAAGGGAGGGGGGRGTDRGTDRGSKGNEAKGARGDDTSWQRR